MKEYKATINKKDVSKLSKRQVENISYKNDELSFRTDEKNIKDLIDKIENMKYVNVVKMKIKRLMHKYLISIISLLIICLLLINQNISVREIKFVNYDTYDEEVEAYLHKYLKKVGPFYYLNADLNTVNYDFKNKFYNYEWIGINKKGSVLEIKIKKQGELEYKFQEDGIVGDYVAKKDAIVKMYYVKKGVVLVKELQSVNKGDLLITGNLKHLIGGEEYIKPNGIVIAETLEYQNVTVKKVQEQTLKTGKLITKNRLGFFKINFKDKVKYSQYEKEVKTIFKLGNILKYETNYYYEVNNLKYVYTHDEALEYAKSVIEKEFKTTIKYEMIKYIELLNEDETDENFLFRFIVKKHENIAQFVPYN